MTRKTEGMPWAQRDLEIYGMVEISVVFKPWKNVGNVGKTMGNSIGKL